MLPPVINFSLLIFQFFSLSCLSIFVGFFGEVSA
jgi:hypothetical protein